MRQISSITILGPYFSYPGSLFQIGYLVPISLKFWVPISCSHIIVSVQVEVIGLSRRFARVVDQLVKMGVSYLRRHLDIVIGPLTELLNGLLLQFAPDDLTTFLL